MIKRYLPLAFLLPLALIFWACLGAKNQPTESKKTAQSRPNIVVVLCDDLGYADVGFNGSKDIITPELDKLANNGTIFSSAYVPHAFCGPSRAGIMTGRYPHEFGSQFNLPANSLVYGDEGIPVSETFFSSVLQESGYYTGAIGKWHLGDKPQFHPNKRGFDDFYGFLGGGHNYFPSEYRPKYERLVEAGNTNIWDYLLPLEHNGVEVQETEYITDALSREASRFVKEASKKEEPFFLYLAYNAPHTPLEAKEEDMKVFDNIKDKNRRTYAGMVYAVDRGVGELVKTLKETNQFDNTLIVFLSDNGGRPDKGANNAPLKGRKGDTYEGGFRVPMFFHWPNKVPSGKHFEYPVSALDFYATFTGLANAKIPEGKHLDSKNIWDDVVAGKNPRAGDPIFSMRHRSGFSDVGVRQDEWKATKAYNSPWKLYNIKKDIGEKHDLGTKHPKVLKEMVSKAEAWSKTHTEPQWFDPENLSKVWKEDHMGAFLTTFEISE
ncbi:sulfatase-like hydrolase/transferase [Tamlana agarivorans]|uniref:Sulfatase-like hydrolase/transferase n=1 Tax=Pseudotamlana agarivorans TaxID=481183 RepID=A0ACC5U9J6_9FLAO|nr:sulfatase-like hydrolase/transferase [Tamlana agarivorans]MBU2951007.1 sulfatase-like hydrolase/transferase [Tamlana agarivorans]